MTVYIEYVIINNFIIDYLLLRFTFLLTGKRVKNIRIIILSIVGAVSALLFPLIKLNNVYLTVIKVLLGTLLIILSARYSSKKEFIANLSVFYFLTFLFGGSVFALYFITGISYSNELIIAVCFVPTLFISYFIKSVIGFLYKRKNVESVIYDFEFTLFNEKFFGRGFLDTGNSLYYKDNPVIICQKNFIKKVLNKNDFYKRLKRISVNTATTNGEKFCIDLEEFKIFIGDKPNIYNNVTLTIAEVKIIGADAILHPALLGVKYESSNNGKFEKVS